MGRDICCWKVIAYGMVDGALKAAFVGGTLLVESDPVTELPSKQPSAGFWELRWWYFAGRVRPSNGAPIETAFSWFLDSSCGVGGL